MHWLGLILISFFLLFSAQTASAIDLAKPQKATQKEAPMRLNERKTSSSPSFSDRASAADWLVAISDDYAVYLNQTDVHWQSDNVVQATEYWVSKTIRGKRFSYITNYNCKTYQMLVREIHRYHDDAENEFETPAVHAYSPVYRDTLASDVMQTACLPFQRWDETAVKLKSGIPLN